MWRITAMAPDATVTLYSVMVVYTICATMRAAGLDTPLITSKALPKPAQSLEKSLRPSIMYLMAPGETAMWSTILAWKLITSQTFRASRGIYVQPRKHPWWMLGKLAAMTPSAQITALIVTGLRHRPAEPIAKFWMSNGLLSNVWVNHLRKVTEDELTQLNYYKNTVLRARILLLKK